MLDIAIVQALITAVMGLFPSAPSGVSSFVSTLTAQLPTLVAAGSDIDAFVQAQLATVRTMIAENRDPTQAEWDALDDTMSAELAKLNAQGTTP